MKIYVDIDNTICNTENSDYHNSKPRQKQIDKINKCWIFQNEDNLFIHVK